MEEPMTITKRRVLANAALVLAVGLLGACGGGSGDEDGDEVASLEDGESSSDSSPDNTATADTASTDPEQAMLDFAECMRDHGVEMDDPQFDGEGGGGIELEATPENEDEIEAAQEACQPIMENARGEIEVDPEREAEMREQMLEYAQCMRDHGIDMPDPVFSDEGGFVVQQGGPGSGGANPRDDDDFEAAQEACQPDEGFGPGGAVTDQAEDG
jgi:hypothetical protein